MKPLIEELIADPEAAPQIDRVLASGSGDIDAEFLGFTDIYQHLSQVIPKHFTVVDLGCAYAPQAFYFRNHRAYIGVDLPMPEHPIERFSFKNSRFYLMPIKDYIAVEVVLNKEFDLDTAFAICSYVPSWVGDNSEMVRRAFKNCFVFYPAGDPAFLETQEEMIGLVRKPPPVGWNSVGA